MGKASPSPSYVLEKLLETRFREGWVYAVQGDDGTPFKIGWAVSPTSRLTTLQTGNPQRLRLLAVIPGSQLVEHYFHRRLKCERIIGEWFAGEQTEALVREMHDLALASLEFFHKYGFHQRAVEAPERRNGRDVSPVVKTTVPPSPVMDPAEAEEIRQLHRRMKNSLNGDTGWLHLRPEALDRLPPAA